MTESLAEKHLLYKNHATKINTLAEELCAAMERAADDKLHVSVSLKPYGRENAGSRFERPYRFRAHICVTKVTTY